MRVQRHLLAGEGVSGVAMHRRPLSIQPPADLVMFDPEQWPSGPDDPADVTWFPASERWCAARRAWLAERPDSDGLGDQADLLAAETRTQATCMDRYPFEPSGPVQVVRYQLVEGVFDPVSGLRGRLPGEEHLPVVATG